MNVLGIIFSLLSLLIAILSNTIFLSIIINTKYRKLYKFVYMAYMEDLNLETFKTNPISLIFIKFVIINEKSIFMVFFSYLTSKTIILLIFIILYHIFISVIII